MNRYQIPPDRAGERLDRLLAELCPDHSRTRLQAWIRAGGVAVDGVRATRSAISLEVGQVVSFEPPREPEATGGSRTELRLLHEDSELCVLDKPAGQICHPAGAHRGDSISERLTERYGELPDPQGEDRPGIVHRLDAQTSGVLVVARTERAALGLMQQFRERQVRKTYAALVRGVPRFHSDWIELAIARRPGSDRMRAVGAGVAIRDRAVRGQAVEPEQGGALPEGAREAQSFYEVQESFGIASLLDVAPRTGRTHQIRVHLEAIGQPIVGDEAYAGRGLRNPPPRWPKEAPQPARQALHASKIAFRHPVSNEPLEFESPLPEDLERLLAWLRAREG